MTTYCSLPLVALVLCCLTSVAAPAQMKSGKNSITVESFTIHQEVDFTAGPDRIYKALLDSKDFSAFSAQAGEFSANSARIDATEGGAFTLFDGYITGRTLELAANRRIVQAWHDKDWPEGVYSIIKFELNPKGPGTHLVFDHTGFPPRSHDHLAAGWKSHYWEPLAKYLK